MAPVKTAGAVATLLSVAIVSYFLCKTTQQKSSRKKKLQRRRNGLVAAIGNTLLIRINSLSEATGCEILGKAEFMNPGGSVKDRVAVKIIEEALDSGALAEGGVVTEGSAGSTAISLATVAPAYGCRCHVVIPDDAAIEKGHIWYCFFDHSNNNVTNMSISTIASSYDSNTHQFSSPAIIRYI